MAITIATRFFAACLSLALAALLCPLAFAGDIDHAAATGDVEEIKALLKAAPELINKGDEMEMTPLHFAAAFGQYEAAEMLLAHKALVDAEDKMKATPSYYAVESRHIRVAELYWRTEPM